MRVQGLFLPVTAALLIAGVAGCSDDAKPAAQAAPAAATTTPGVDQAALACTHVLAALKSTDESVASAKSMGGQAAKGQAGMAYMTGYAQVYPLTIDLPDSAVKDAGQKVADELKALSTALVDQSTAGTATDTALTTAVIQFKAACAQK